VISDANFNLTAAAMQTVAGSFASPPLDSPRPLPLGITGHIAPNGCASTADGTADTVYAYSNGIFEFPEAIGIRFNVFSGKIYPPMVLIGIAAGGMPSCTNGNERCTVAGSPLPNRCRRHDLRERGQSRRAVGCRIQPSDGLSRKHIPRFGLRQFPRHQSEGFSGCDVNTVYFNIKL
jgi:hypothetical protein